MTTDKKSNPKKAKPLPREWGGLVIRVLVEKNPKRAGSLAHQKFALLKNEMTPAEYVALEAEHALDRPWAGRELKHFIEKGFVELCVPLPGGTRISAPRKKKA